MVNIYFENATGTLNAPVSYPILHGGNDDLDVGDVNQDGLQDIVVMSGDYYSHNVGTLLQQPGGTFSAPVYHSIGGGIESRGLAVGDINGDSLDDMVLTNGTSMTDASLAIFRQNASHTFDPATTVAAFVNPGAVEVADVNGDSKKDVLVLNNGWQSLSVFLQDGNGNLLPYESYELPYASSYILQGLAVGDVSGDGEPDVVIGDYNNGLVVLYHSSQKGIPDILPLGTPNFASVHMGTTTVKKFYIANVGPSDLNLQAASITGTDAAQFSIVADYCSNTAVGFYRYCSIDISYTPTSPGSPDASIVIPTNDPDTPTFSMPITACATYPYPDQLFSPYASFEVGSWPEATAIGDVNSDGRNDALLITSDYSDAANDNRLFVFLQNDHGGLDSPTRYLTSGNWGMPPQSVAIGDVNGDGKNDVVVGNRTNTMDIFLQNAAGGLDSALTIATDNAFSVKIGDVNNDGRMDVVGLGWDSDQVDVFLQTAGGSLNPPINYQLVSGGPGQLALGDVNNDRLTDIVVMNGNEENQVGILLQNASGFDSPVYRHLGIYDYANSLAVGDINNDQLQDVVVAYGGNRPESNIGIFFQDGSAALSNPVNYDSYDIPSSLDIADVNRDGKKDVVVMHDGWNSLGVYRQDTYCTLAPEELYPIPSSTPDNAHAVAVGDINGDGMNDVTLPNYGGDLVVLYHSSPDNAPNLSTPASESFGTVILSAAASRTITISNIGAAELAISSISLTGTNAGEFRATGGCSVIPANGSCTIAVDFVPVTEGGKQAALRINSNDPDLPVREIELGGSGRVDVLTLSSPNGGEVLISGSLFTLTWGAPASAAKFTLQYSTNNGSTWKQIATGITGTSYPWTVPAVNRTKDQCLIEVTGYTASGAVVGTDRSDGVFTLQ